MEVGDQEGSEEIEEESSSTSSSSMEQKPASVKSVEQKGRSKTPVSSEQKMKPVSAKRMGAVLFTGKFTISGKSDSSDSAYQPKSVKLPKKTPSTSGNNPSFSCITVINLEALPGFVNGMPLPTHISTTPHSSNVYDPMKDLVKLGEKPIMSAYRRGSNVTSYPIVSVKVIV